MSSDPILNKHGMTELHVAAYQGDLTWVRSCIAGGLQVNARDSKGYTPLHWVVDMGCAPGEREEIVQALMDAGADPESTDDQGRTVREVAIETTSEYLIPLLERK
jgi:ankyrin repeat protein